MTPEEFLTKMLAGLGIDPAKYETATEEPDTNDAIPDIGGEAVVAAWLEDEAGGDGDGADE